MKDPNPAPPLECAPMALDANIMGATEDLEPPADEPSSIDTVGSIWLSLGLVEMSDPDCEEEGPNFPRDIATCLLPLHDARTQDPHSVSGDSKPQGWSTESGFGTEVSATNKRRRINPPSPIGEMETTQSGPNYQPPRFTWARSISTKSDTMHDPPRTGERD